MAKGKTKLKDLEIAKVDFVNQGANPGADIVLMKGKGRPAEGFWQGLVAYIKKQIGGDPEIIDEIGKSGAQSFEDKMSERSTERIRDEIWSVCFALENSLISILMDDELDKAAKKKAMEQSTSEFSQAMTEFVSHWSNGTRAEIEKHLENVFVPDEEVLKAMMDNLEGMRKQAAKKRKQLKEPARPERGECQDMLIDKSKMTPEDIAQIERMAKAYGWELDGSGNGAAAGTATKEPPAGEDGKEETEKGLHPVVQAQIDALKKMMDSVTERELKEVAKKYEIIGKKGDDLIPILKELKTAGDDAYNNYIAILDEMVTLQEKSGLFTEIGKSGGSLSAGQDSEAEAFAKAQAKAAEIRKSRPDLTEEEAIMMAVEQDTELWSALQ